jgi:hypothetical protein
LPSDRRQGDDLARILRGRAAQGCGRHFDTARAKSQYGGPGEGRERAKAKGVQFGRPPKMSVHQRREALQRMDASESVVDLARTFGVDRATLYRMQALTSALKTEC